MRILDALRKSKRGAAPKMMSIGMLGENGNAPDKSTDTEKLDENGKLPWGWYGRHQDEIRAFEDRIVSCTVFARDMSNKVDDRIAAYKSLIALYYERKEYFLKSGECYAKYFSDLWMQRHSKRFGDFNYIEMREHELVDLLENYDDLKRREELLPTLEASLQKCLKENAPIRQTDVYKAFDPVLKNDVQGMLYWMDRSGRIKREKSGRTYIISLPQGKQE